MSKTTETPSAGILEPSFFNKEPLELAQVLLGKVLRKRHLDPCAGEVWLAARIIETEAYYLNDKASHSSLGFTQKRRALFMEPGTIYMYYARGADSLNFSALGEGNAVLIKSGYAWVDGFSPPENLEIMKKLNPLGRDKKNSKARSRHRLCSGQTLLCKSMGLKVKEWNQQQLNQATFYLEETTYKPGEVIQAQRLGIPPGRDHQLFYRFIDKDFSRYATSNPLTKPRQKLGQDYFINKSGNIFSDRFLS